MGYNDHIKLIGVGKDSHMSNLSNWTGGNDASVTADAQSDGFPAWDEWDASQRDLYILNHEGELVFHENITDGLPSDLQDFIMGLIFESSLFTVDYYTQIQPIFNSSCTNCHNPSSNNWNNHQLNLTSYAGVMAGSEDGAVIVPGNAESSVLYQEILSGDMPDGNNPDLSSTQINLIAEWINEGALEFESTCDEGFIEITDVPVTCIVFDGSSCFHEGDLQVLADILESNGIFNLDPLYMGSQNWLDGRLIRIQVGNYFQGGNIELTSLPESISDLENLATLQVDKNALASLPDGVGELSNLQLLIASNNDLVSVPESINNLTQVWYLDLGYNSLQTLPEISNMSSLMYLYIFGNEISSLSETICDLDLDWSGFDNSFMPYFACGGNQLCENVPGCIANSENFEIGLEANYYSFTIQLLQDCGDDCVAGDINGDGSIDVLDVVNSVNFILGNSNPTEQEACAADVNSDGNIDVLDVVTIVNLILN
jgi:hypothetical protein